MKVLIADDEPGTRLFLSATLDRLGHECVAAAYTYVTVGYLVEGAPPDEIERAIRSAARW